MYLETFKKKFWKILIFLVPRAIFRYGPFQIPFEISYFRKNLPKCQLEMIKSLFCYKNTYGYVFWGKKTDKGVKNITFSIPDPFCDVIDPQIGP